MAGSYKDLILSDKPAGYWRFDDVSGTTVADESGFWLGPHHATLVGSPTLGVPGAMPGSKAIRFTPGSYASTDGRHPGPLSAYYKFLFECWLRRTDLSSGNRSIVGEWDEEALDNPLDVWMDGSGKILTKKHYFGSPTEAGPFSSSLAITDTNWHHFAILYDAYLQPMSHTFYIDGVKDGPYVNNEGWGGGPAGAYWGWTGTYGPTGGLEIDEAVVYPIESNNGGTLPPSDERIWIHARFPKENTASHFVIHRPLIPAGATGWYAHAQKKDEAGDSSSSNDVTGRLFFRSSGEGRDFAISPSRAKIDWSGDLVEAQDPYGVVLSPHQLPTENTTGVEPPDSEPEIPIAFGAARPGPGLKHVRVVDRVGNRRSKASEPASQDIASDEILRIIHRDHTNLLANGDNIELDANGLPLDHSIQLVGGAVRVEGRELILETFSAQTGATPLDSLDPVPIDITKAHAAWGYLKLREPRSGVLTGTAEVVLRELSATNQITATVLYAYTQVGDYEYHKTISPVGSTGSGVVAWRSDTVSAGLMIRMTGASMNMHIRSSRVVLKDHVHKFRWEEEPPDTELHRPPGSQQQLGFPPSVAPPPKTLPYPDTDRPKLAGAVRESADFEAGMPSGWTQTTAGGGTIARSASAALVGSFGLKLSDASTASPNSRASFTKVFDSAGSREMGLSRKIRPALLPNGKLTLGGIARPSDGQLFVWPETGSLNEIQTLTIDGSPTAPGNFTLIPDGASAAVAVVATRQVERITVTQAPNANGVVSTVLNGKRFNAATRGGSREYFQLTLQSPRQYGWIGLYIGGINYYIWVDETDGPVGAAKKVANTSFPGWDVGYKESFSGSNIVSFRSKTAGSVPDAQYSRGTSDTPGTITILEQGDVDTAVELADRIAIVLTAYAREWTIAHTPGSTIITATAVQAGAKSAPSIDWGASGANGSITTLTPGDADTPSELAARIRGTAFSGWTLSGSGAQVILTANAVGWKRDLRIDPGQTGVRYHIVATQQGKNADITAHYKDDSGAVYSQPIMEGLFTTTTYNVDVDVQGAGTKNGTITFWGSIGSAVKEELWRVDNVSLVNYPAGMVDAGVSAEAAASETWEVHVDNIKVTDKGEAYYEEFNELAERVGQFHHYGLPTQPKRSDIGIQEWREPCMPGVQYAISTKIRTDNVPVSIPAKPVFVTAHFEDGSTKDIRDLTGPSGISGTHDWYETTPLLVTPEEGCYELGFQSRDLSSGEIVVQRVAMSPGSVVKRTRRYATSGSYTATLPATTPYQPGVSAASRGVLTFWGSKRRRLGIVADVPVGASLTTLYRSADTQAGLPAEAYISNPALVPDRGVIQVQVAFTSDGINIPILKSGSPYVAYDDILGGMPLSVFLRADRSEFDGGVVFANLLEYAEPPEVAIDVGPGLHLRPQILSENAAILPAGSLYVFTADALKEIRDNYYKSFVVETDYEALGVRLSGEPTVERIAPSYWIDGKKYGVWSVSLAWGEILYREPLT